MLNRMQMPEVRVELTRGCPHRILSPARLPFRHSGKWAVNIAEFLRAENWLAAESSDSADVAESAVRQES